MVSVSQRVIAALALGFLPFLAVCVHADLQSPYPLKSFCQSQFNSDHTDEILAFMELVLKERQSLSRAEIDSLTTSLELGSAIEISTLGSNTEERLTRELLISLLNRNHNPRRLAAWLKDLSRRLQSQTESRNAVEQAVASKWRLPKFVRIPKGRHSVLDAPRPDGADMNMRRVEFELTYDFEVMDIPVTQALWLQIMRRPPFGKSYLDPNSEDVPISEVSLFEAMEYANRLSAANGLPPVYEMPSGLDPLTLRQTPVRLPEPDPSKMLGYRLPTEAEWLVMMGPTIEQVGLVHGDHVGQFVERLGWLAGTSGGSLHEVGQTPPAQGPQGLIFDLVGNVYEMLHGRFDRILEGGLNPTTFEDLDGSGEKFPSTLTRGGGHATPPVPRIAQVKYKNGNRMRLNTVDIRRDVVDEFHGTGFRLVRTLPEYAQ